MVASPNANAALVGNAGKLAKTTGFAGLLGEPVGAVAR